MSWMHDRVQTPLSRRRPARPSATTIRSPFGSPGAAPDAATAGTALLDLDHAGIPSILGRRARWMTSRLRQR
jgi:hypothetical protein